MRVAIWYRIQPAAHTSAFSPYGLPWTTSGLYEENDEISSMCYLLQLTFSLPMANLTKSQETSNPELSDETQRCDHWNKSSLRVHSNHGNVFLLLLKSLFSCIEKRGLRLRLLGSSSHSVRKGKTKQRQNKNKVKWSP